MLLTARSEVTAKKEKARVGGSDRNEQSSLSPASGKTAKALVKKEKKVVKREKSVKSPKAGSASSTPTVSSSPFCLFPVEEESLTDG